MLTDIWKAFFCICHDLLIAKLNAYRFDRNALMLIYDYLSDRSQKTKVGSLSRHYLWCTTQIYTWASAVYNRSL